MLGFSLLFLRVSAAATCSLEALPQDRSQAPGCVSYLLEQGYGAAPDPERLTLDPAPFGQDELRYTRSTLQQAAPILAAACPSEDPPGRCARAQEVLQSWVDRRLGTFESCCALEDARPLLDLILRGEPLPADALKLSGGDRRWSPLTLWKLRNAVFARHGRPFQHADLQAFFYGPERRWTQLAVVPSFSDSHLTPTDRANLAMIQAAEAQP